MAPRQASSCLGPRAPQPLHAPVNLLFCPATMPRAARTRAADQGGPSPAPDAPPTLSDSEIPGAVACMFLLACGLDPCRPRCFCSGLPGPASHRTGRCLSVFRLVALSPSQMVLDGPCQSQSPPPCSACRGLGGSSHLVACRGHPQLAVVGSPFDAVSYTHLRAHET